MTATHLYPQIQTANEDPLNQMARLLLPTIWREPDELSVLTLMRWGLSNGLYIRPLSPTHPDQDQVEAMIDLLARTEPDKVMAFLTNPETEPDGETILTMEAMEQAATPEAAASLLLEALFNSMVVTAP